MKRQRHHSVRDRSRGTCQVCDGEYSINPSTGKLYSHKTLVGSNRVVCQGANDYPAKVTHEPDMQVSRIAKITTSARVSSPVRRPRRAGAGTRKAPVSPARVTVTKVDPKVWSEAVRLCRPGQLPVIAFRAKARA